MLSSDGESAVHTAGYWGNLEVLNLLSEYGADFNQDTNVNLKYQRNIKPYYNLAFFSSIYLEDNKNNIEEHILFYKNEINKNNVDLGVKSWMLNYECLLNNADNMSNMLTY